MTAREAAVAVALSWVGQSGSHREIVKLYNQQEKLPRGYALTVSDDWCAATDTAIAVKLGYLDFMPGECSVGRMVQRYQELGRWVEDDSFLPRPGDLICYDWHDSGAGDNLGWPDHMGMVTAVQDGILTVAEGNMAGGVMGTTTLAVGARYIRGYCCPDYEGHEGPAADPMAAELAALPRWAAPTVEKLVRGGILLGRDGGLDLTDDMMRILVILDRAGCFDTEGGR